MSNWHEVVASTMPEDDNELAWWRTSFDECYHCGKSFNLANKQDAADARNHDCQASS